MPNQLSGFGNQSYDHHNKDPTLFQMWHYFANIFQW
jgi:hypothetical protein